MRPLLFKRVKASSSVVKDVETYHTETRASLLRFTYSASPTQAAMGMSTNKRCLTTQKVSHLIATPLIEYACSGRLDTAHTTDAERQMR